MLVYESVYANLWRKALPRILIGDNLYPSKQPGAGRFTDERMIHQ
jgi:hypothetical protein